MPFTEEYQISDNIKVTAVSTDAYRYCGEIVHTTWGEDIAFTAWSKGHGSYWNFELHLPNGRNMLIYDGKSSFGYCVKALKNTLNSLVKLKTFSSAVKANSLDF